MSTQLIKLNYLVILPPTQHHSFFRNLPPLLVVITLGHLTYTVVCSCYIPTADGELDEQIKQILRNRSREDLTEVPSTGKYLTALALNFLRRPSFCCAPQSCNLEQKPRGTFGTFYDTHQTNTSLTSPLTPHTMLKTSTCNFS